MSRTNNKWIRPYLNGVRAGYDAVNVGTVGVKYDVTPLSAYVDEIKNAIPGRGDVTAAPLNAVMSPGTANSLHDMLSTGLGTLDYMIAYGIQAIPKQGDPIFAARFEQASYQAEPGDGFVMVNLDLFSTFATSNPAALAGYSMPFGVLLHADGAETGANTAAGIDDFGAATTGGGVMFYHLFSSNGTVTLSMDDAATNSNLNFSALSGATSGSINASVTPKSGQVALTQGATVRRYLRWQLAFGTADTATFVIGFMRGH